MEKIAPEYRYLASDDKFDYYIVDELAKRATLTIVYGDAEVGEYLSYPIYNKKMEDLLVEKLKKPDMINSNIAKCYEIYNKNRK